MRGREPTQVFTDQMEVAKSVLTSQMCGYRSKLNLDTKYGLSEQMGGKGGN